MKKRRIAALGLAVMTSLALMSGCGRSENTSGNETVTLKWIMPGAGEQRDSQLVWKEFNEKLKEYLPNVKVDFSVYTLSEYKQQFMLKQSVGDVMDIVNVYGLNFADELRKGSFIDIAGYVDEYGKDMKEAIPEFVWNYMRHEGKLYGVPTYQMLSVDGGLYAPKALADKYLDAEALNSALRGQNTLGTEFLDVIEDYLKKAKEGGELGLGFNCYTNYMKGFETILDYYVIRKDDEKCRVELVFETPEMKEYFERKAKWYKEGYIRQDSLSANDDMVGKPSGYILWYSTGGWKAAETASQKYGMDINYYPYDPDNTYYIPMSNTAMGTSISATSKHSKEAVQLLNLINSPKGKDLYNMLVYGIEGNHYTKTGNDTIKTEYSGQVTSNDRYGMYKWIVGNTENAYDTQSDLEGYKEWAFNEVNQSTNFSRLIGFMADPSSISTKLAQVLAVKGEYFNSLHSGAMEEVDVVYAEFMDKLQRAGNEEIKVELQKQVDAFLATK